MLKKNRTNSRAQDAEPESAEVEAMALAPRRSAPAPVRALLCLIFAILLGAAFFSYAPEQDPNLQSVGSKSTAANVSNNTTNTPFLNSSTPKPNLVGELGVKTSSFAFRYAGIVAWSLPIFLILATAAYLFHRKHIFTIGRAIAFLSFFAAACAFSAILSFHVFGHLSGTEATPPIQQSGQPSEASDYSSNFYPDGLGGWLGQQIYSNYVRDMLGVGGSLTIFGGGLLISGLFLFIYRFPHTFETILNRYLANRRRRKEERRLQRESRAEGQPPLPTGLPDLPVATTSPAKQRGKLEEEIASGNPLPIPPPPPAPPKRKGWFFSKFRQELPPLPDIPTPEIQIPGLPKIEKASNREAAPESPAKRLGQKPKPEPIVPELSQEEESAPAPAHVIPTPPARTSPLRQPAPRAAASKSSEEGPKIIQSEKVEKAHQHLPKKKGDYIFPPLDLLTPAPAANTLEAEDYQETGEALVRTLETFGVKVTLKDIHVGPVITRYDVLPAPGTRVSNIQNLENDIAMGMQALAVRILAPVPGTGFVGVEVPNRNPQPVCLREILESKVWADSKAEIPIGLGKDVSGNPLVADLTKMPHLLIAGSTGAGKTVCINSIIASLLYHASPDDLKFIMIDPKVVEMQVYNNLPHMLIPVVTEPKKVPQALKWLINEMTRRYNLFAKVRVRNISGYNAYQKKQKSNPEPIKPTEPNEQGEFDIPRELEDEIEMPEKLPYIVCIIDELADLMMVAPADVETGIARLAQLARAAGIHLILATQRPSVKVITGTIKANLPSRISFKVAAVVDSRTILDAKGAEQLIGKGDMLFLPPGQARLVRSQGAFVSDEEINGIVDFLSSNNGEPQFEMSVQREIDKGEDSDTADGEDADELMEAALDVLRTTKRASTSMLQRKLKIGYNRAARIMETLEDRGIVGPENGASPREILIDPDDL